MVVLNNLTTVDNLTVPLGLDDIKDELGILRLVGINFFAIKQIKGIGYFPGQQPPTDSFSSPEF